MGLKIIKLAATSKTKIVTTPSVTRYFYEADEHIAGANTLKIDASDFLDDTGKKVSFLPPLNLNNSYFSVYINGVLQMDDNFAYTAGEKGIGHLLISIPEDSDIDEGTPIILEVVNFHPVLISTIDT